MKWTTKDGEQIEISKLDDSHLTNIYRMIARKAEEGMIG